MPAEPVAELRRDLIAVADPGRAPAMAAYMKNRFEFLGVVSPVRKDAQKSFIAASGGHTGSALFDLVDACWAEPEREFHYVGTDLLIRWVRLLASSDLSRVEQLIRTKSWWDTVDALAANVVGPMVATDPELAATMDRWVDDTDLWVARTALLHQLKFRSETDVDRLFGYAERRAPATEFFIRKAIGWSLREYAKTDPDPVRRFVADQGDRLSGLTRREALKHL